MDLKALYNLTYGVYLLSAREDGRDNACIINTAVQVANQPTRISIAAIKGNLTHDMILRTGRFNLSAITKDAEFSLFRHFGLQSGRNVDKFAEFSHVARSGNGLYYLTKWSNAWMSLQVTQSYDLGSHTLFIAELVDAQVLGPGECCTYGYYQTAIKQTAPRPAVKKGWRCKVCGYVHEGADLPEDFRCPLCKHGPEDFEYFDETASAAEKYVCPVCGYVHEGVPPVDFVCPVCKVSGAKFKVMEGDSLAAEHGFGVYEKTVAGNPDISAADKEFIKEQLFANFSGECSEVGMYLCMARIAHREGQPQAGLYWEKAAREEAEHAAKFAELLGETLEPNMKASTKANLAWRVDCEFGATQGKHDLAACCRRNGLDAMADTIMEMAKDEARHGKALKGLLDRYFK